MQPGPTGPFGGLLPLRGLLSKPFPDPKNYSEILPKPQFPDKAGLQARQRDAAREARPTECGIFSTD